MLQELDECLIQQATIAKIDRPSPYNLEMLRRWLDSSTKGKGFLVGLEEETWKEIHSHDFLAIPRPEKDVELDRLFEDVPWSTCGILPYPVTLPLIVDL